MNHFHIREKISGSTYTISQRELLHRIRDVLRLGEGDAIVLFDIEGNEYLGTITRAESRRVVLSLMRLQTEGKENLKLTVACAIPKRSRLDDIIDKLTQLGVDTIIPLETERTIVRIKEDGASRLERWQKIALKAAEQSGRNTLTSVSAVAGLEEVIKQSIDYDLKLLPTLEGERKQLREIIPSGYSGNIMVLIGPEGDFTPQEVARLIQAGFVPVSLGRSVLRIETAAVAVASYLRFALTE